MGEPGDGLRLAIVFFSGAVYWSGVAIKAYFLKRRLGRSPDLKPQDAREKWLWLGWGLVIAGWVAAPFLPEESGFFGPLRVLFFPFVMETGIFLVLASFAGTLWSHAAMGDAWRVSVGHDKPPLVTAGPYAHIRHPIYAFQMLVLAGACLAWPAPFLLILLVLLAACVAVKVRDEEAYLQAAHGADYENYRRRTGALWPKF